MRNLVRTAATALVAAALTGLAAGALTITATLAHDLLIAEVVPAAAALTAGGLWLAVGNLFVPSRSTRSRVAVRRVGPAPAVRVVGRAVVPAGATTA